MEIYTFRRILFPTHVGTSETNDNYIYIPKVNEVINSLFQTRTTHTINVIDKITGTVYSMLVSFPRSGAECRIAGQFAGFVRRHGLISGDEVIFELIKYSNNKSVYYISFQKHHNSITSQYRNNIKKYTLENGSRISTILENTPSEITVNYRGNTFPITITDGGLEKLKSNSPESTKTYNIYGLSTMGLTGNKFILDQIKDNEFRGKDFIAWTFIMMKERE